MYNQVYTRLASIANQTPKKYASISLGEGSAVKKFYLFTYRAKDGKVDAKLKEMFSIEFKRDQDYIIGVMVSHGVDVGKIIEQKAETSVNEESTYSNFKELLDKNNNSVFETLNGLFGMIILEKIYDDLENRMELISFFSTLKELKFLTNDEKRKLKEKFGSSVPDFIKIIMLSSNLDSVNQVKVENKAFKKVESEEDEWILDDSEYYRRKELEKAMKSESNGNNGRETAEFYEKQRHESDSSVERSSTDSGFSTSSSFERDRSRSRSRDRGFKYQRQNFHNSNRYNPMGRHQYKKYDHVNKKSNSHY
jgi:hypothetical protein